VPGTGAPGGAPVPEGYVLEPGDQISVNVYGEPDLSRTIIIKPDGTIALSLINEVRAAGKTTTQLEAEITQKFAKYLKAPSVSVVVTQTRVDHVYLLGQVGRPGDYELRPNENIFELLSAAGGPTNRADLQKAVIIRGKTQTLNLDLFSAVKNNQVPDVRLKAGDVLYIPETDRRIVALGMVQRPGPYDLLEGQHLSDLIAAAGGLNSKAAMDKAFIVRDGTQVPVDLHKVMAGDATSNVALRAGDMLVVPENKERVLVMGTVAKPGPYDYTENMTLIDAIAAAGGATDKSNLAGVQVVRVEDGKTKTIPVKADQAMNGKDLSQNIRMENGDLVYVPQRGMNLLEIINAIGVFRWMLGF
jgi:polysaccharide export outer membrane protein